MIVTRTKGSGRAEEPTPRLTRRQAKQTIEASYLAAASALIWIALYYLPVGGAFFRLALPMPLALLQVRRGAKSGLEGLLITVLLLTILMGPVRGPLILFPYGFLAIWLGWSWQRQFSWWTSWPVGVVIGTSGFLVRVFVLSVLIGENLWVVITRAGSGILEKLLELLNSPVVPGLFEVQIVALVLVIFQEVIYVLALHALAFWVFPRLKAPIPQPPRILHSLVSLDPL